MIQSTVPQCQILSVVSQGLQGLQLPFLLQCKAPTGSLSFMTYGCDSCDTTKLCCLKLLQRAVCAFSILHKKPFLESKLFQIYYFLLLLFVSLNLFQQKHCDGWSLARRLSPLNSLSLSLLIKLVKLICDSLSISSSTLEALYGS